MDSQHEQIPPKRRKAYLLFFLIERLLATGLFSFAVIQTSQSALGGVWWLLVVGAVGFAALSAWTIYLLMSKPNGSAG